MKRPQEIRRIFNKSDEAVLQQSDLKWAAFEEHKQLFTERFPQLKDPFSAEWAKATEAARNIPPDYASLANQTSETEALNVLMDQGANLYQMLLLYVKIAFPNDPSMLRLMGQHKYDKARQNHLKFPVLLQTAFENASLPEIKQQLLEKGMTEAEIASLKTAADHLVKQNIAQENAIKNRTKNLNIRITAMNRVWEKMSLVCHCAKLVFQKDATRYALFLLPDDLPFTKPEIAPAQLQNA